MRPAGFPFADWWPHRRSDDGRSESSTPALAVSLAVGAAYGCLFLLLGLHLPPEVFDPGTRAFILALGWIAAWRYSWWGTHLLRAVCYRRLMFPRYRRAADKARVATAPERLFVLVTSYRMAEHTTYQVYDALVKNALDYGVPTVVVAAVTDKTDVHILNEVLAANGDPDGVDLRFMYQYGDGKRTAMAEALRLISREMPATSDVVVFMDGDIKLPPGTLARSIPFFMAQPDLGALTTDNGSIVAGDDWTKAWYDLRSAQRDLIMSSMALSGRLLVLTGRYSVFRSEIVTDARFIKQIEEDYVEHWRFGRFKFLSGDDKSSWFWLLKQKWRMLYVPDVIVYGFEELPDRNRFVSSTIGLMRRWFGNMLRANGGAVALGPRHVGLFCWWSLVDQRLSMWTALVGPTGALLLAISGRPDFIVVYLFWIMMTRLLAAALLGLARRRFSTLWPVLLYYNQIIGALVKIHVSVRTNQQKWTRQQIIVEAGDQGAIRRQLLIGAALQTVYVSVFALAVAFATKVLPIPDATVLRIIAGY